MKNNLPRFAIKGATVQELIEIEMILIMLGYDEPDENWNNIKAEDQEGHSEFNKTPFTVLYVNGCLNYLNHGGVDSKIIFHANQLDEIIDYVLNY
jgi:hypothetical protein